MTYHACPRAAVTPAGFCRQHDPELAKERAAKRPPTKYSRQCMIRERLHEFLTARLSPSDYRIVHRAITAAYCDWADAPWPIDALFEAPK